jgi:hypothetical protein
LDIILIIFKKCIKINWIFLQWCKINFFSSYFKEGCGCKWNKRWRKFLFYSWIILKKNNSENTIFWTNQKIVFSKLVPRRCRRDDKTTHQKCHPLLGNYIKRTYFTYKNQQRITFSTSLATYIRKLSYVL